MREIKYTTRFKRDYRREKSGQHGKKLDLPLMDVVNLRTPDLIQGNWEQLGSGHDTVTGGLEWRTLLPGADPYRKLCFRFSPPKPHPSMN